MAPVRPRRPLGAAPTPCQLVFSRKVAQGMGAGRVATSRRTSTMCRMVICTAAHITIYLQTAAMGSGCPKSPFVNARAWPDSA